MKAGDTFYLPDFAGAHINFVLDVLPDGSVITCNFTDHANHNDKTCVVEIGEHPKITKKSVVNFQKAHYCECGTALDALTRLIERYFEPLDATLLARIRQGAIDSPRTSDIIKEILRNE